MKTVRSRGFTLVEIIVVMAIIAILASLVTGAINVARRTARNTERLNNLKTVSTALEAYYGKNKQYPEVSCAGPWGDVWKGFMTTMVSGKYLETAIIDPDPYGSPTYLVACTDSSNKSSYLLAAVMEGGDKDNSSYCFPWTYWTTNKNKLEIMGPREYPCF